MNALFVCEAVYCTTLNLNLEYVFKNSLIELCMLMNQRMRHFWCGWCDVRHKLNSVNNWLYQFKHDRSLYYNKHTTGQYPIFIHYIITSNCHLLIARAINFILKESDEFHTRKLWHCGKYVCRC